ncbi:MAG: RluA family pseudouridine synthase [Robiginitomaculum sp.]
MSEKTKLQILTRIAHFEDVGIRLDRWLANWSGLSRVRVKALMDEGEVRVDGVVELRPRAKILEEAEYTITVPPAQSDTPEPEDIPLTIIYEDEHLLIVHKPAGMTVHPAVGNRNGTLVNALLHHCRDEHGESTLSGIGGVLRPGIVHRIDKDTSGLLVVAKSDQAHQGLSRQFAKHTVERTYICFVRSGPKPREGRIETRLSRSKHDRKKMGVVKERSNADLFRYGELPESESGKLAITNYKLLKGYGQQPNSAVGTPMASKVQCNLETGRTHQIRVHMGHIGCPLLGDPLYGKQRAFKAMKADPEARAKSTLRTFKRQALHAKTLGFIHPITKEPVQFDSEMPEDMVALEAFLGGL